LKPLEKLARRPLKNHANLFTRLKKILFSDDFLSRHRKSPNDFTRHRRLPFASVILFILNLLKNALQVELNYFFKTIHHTDTADPKVTDSAFCQARKKLRYQAFVELNHEQVSFFYSNYPARTWNDFRLLSMDGSTLQLPFTEEILRHFGGLSFSQERDRPLARVSQLYDVCNKVTLDAVISPYARGERELALHHFSLLKSNDLVLLDRGYPAFWFFTMLLSTSAHFCARMNIDQWIEGKQFYQSGQKETLVALSPCSHSLRICREKNLPTDPLPVRLIRVELENGDVEILISSLLDSERYPREWFASLYHERWGVEECYKTIKHRLQIENFTGKSVETIYQDFHARIFTLNLTAILIHPVQEEITQDSQHKTYAYQVNFTKALSYVKDTLVLLFIRPAISKILDSLMLLFRQKPEPIRPNRRYSRKRKLRNRQTYSFNYKQTR
jgi:hypothetical protein